MEEDWARAARVTRRVPHNVADGFCSSDLDPARMSLRASSLDWRHSAAGRSSPRASIRSTAKMPRAAASVARRCEDDVGYAGRKSTMDGSP